MKAFWVLAFTIVCQLACAHLARAADCNANGVDDWLDISQGTSVDCDGNRVPDECDVATRDCNGNLVPDSCDVALRTSWDCNGNRIPDECDVASQRVFDHNANGIPDECDRDCNKNGVHDEIEVESGGEADCNSNRVPDSCELLASLNFTPPVVLAGERRASGAVAVVIADLDGDGNRDLASAGPSGVEVFRNLGARRFETLGLRSVGSDPAAMAAGDLDGDGDPDLVTANTLPGTNLPGNVSVLLNDGQGSLELRANFAVGRQPVSLVVEELNGDGAADLAVANLASDSVSLLFNRGDGMFGPAVELDLQGRRPFSIVGDDMDFDRDTDLLVAVPSSDAVVALENDGRGSFQVSAIEVRGPARILPGDFDADGDLDLVVGQSLGLTLLENQGGGFPESLKSFRVGYLDGDPMFLAASDFDGDGDLDFAAGCRQTCLWPNVFLNHGRGSFAAVRVLADPRQTSIAAAADLDGDRAPDLALITAGRTAVSFNHPAPQAADCNGNNIPDECDLASRTSADCDSNGVPDECDVARRDCNGNGMRDACDVASGFSNDCNRNGVPDECDLATLDCNANGVPDACDVVTRPSFSVLQSLELENPRLLGSADLDGDGDLDLVTAHSNPGRITVFKGRGDGTFAAASLSLLGGNPSSLDLADLDTDGDVDLVSGAEAGGFAVLRNDGHGAFGDAERYDGPPRSALVAAADLDGDGANDLVLLTLDGLQSARNLGDGTFTSLEALPGSRFRCAASISALAVGDVDDDGDVDLLAAGCHAFALLRNQGNRALLEVVETGIPRGTDPYNAVLVDLNGDGKLDIATGRKVFLNRGDGTFSDAVSHGGLGTSALALDVDFDGHADLVLSRTSSTVPVLVVLLNEGDGSFQSPIEFPQRERWGNLQAGDFDGDGHDDLATLSLGKLSVARNSTVLPVSLDLDQNGIPDECLLRTLFHRGDPDPDGSTDIADAIFVLEFLFSTGAAPRCMETADVDNDGTVGITDAISLLRFLFRGGPAPAAPGPPDRPCGMDTDALGSAGDLGCDLYERC